MWSFFVVFSSVGWSDDISIDVCPSVCLVCLQGNCIIRVSSILLESVLVGSLDTYLFFYLQYSTCTFTFTIYEGLIQSQKPQKMIAAQLHVPFKIILILYTHVILKLNVDP